MAVTTEIPWGDGSGDKIYLTRDASEGDQNVQVSSDANTGSARSKVVTFTSGVGNIQRQLTINQAAGLPYTPLEYIEADGIAYIDSGIKGNAPMSVTGKMLPVLASSNAYFMGCRKDSGNTRFIFLFISTSKYAGFGYANGAYASAVNVATSVDNKTPMEFHTILRSGTNRVGVKQQGESSFTDYTRSINSTITTNTNIHILGYNNHGTPVPAPSGMRCYGVKLYSSNNYTNLVFDGIPVLYNGEYGLWDKVSNSFFGNAAGSGAFTGA